MRRGRSSSSPTGLRSPSTTRACIGRAQRIGASSSSARCEALEVTTAIARAVGRRDRPRPGARADRQARSCARGGALAVAILLEQGGELVVRRRRPGDIPPGGRWASGLPIEGGTVAGGRAGRSGRPSELLRGRRARDQRVPGARGARETGSHERDGLAARVSRARAGGVLIALDRIEDGPAFKRGRMRDLLTGVRRQRGDGACTPPARWRRRTGSHLPSRALSRSAGAGRASCTTTLFRHWGALRDDPLLGLAGAGR